MLELNTKEFQVHSECSYLKKKNINFYKNYFSLKPTNSCLNLPAVFVREDIPAKCGR